MGFPEFLSFTANIQRTWHGQQTTGTSGTALPVDFTFIQEDILKCKWYI